MGTMTHRKILIVEDEQALSDAYEFILKEKGYNVLVARDGAEGLQVVEDFRPELILLDLRMPLVSGIDFLRVYEKKSGSSPAKIVVFSNMDDQKEIQEAFSLGADRYILKAWASPNDLTKIVKEMLE